MCKQRNNEPNEKNYNQGYNHITQMASTLRMLSMQCNNIS